jgi:hypothetical protein
MAWAAAGGCGGETSGPGTGGSAAATGGRTGSGGQGGGTGFDAGQPTVDAGSTTSCSVQSDCAWGEINHEILTAADCPCLYGCPYVLLNQTTVARRSLQYSALCSPGHDGQGRPCGIDDCIMPPTLLCIQGECLQAE